MTDMEHILSMEEIMAAQDITEEAVKVPEWGGSVRVRSISHRDMQKIKKQAANGNGEDEVDSDAVEKFVLIQGLIAPKIDEDQYEHLLEKSSVAVMRILKAILGNSSVDEKAVTRDEKSLPSGSE